jgi:Leucine-rich repeat (LRR) protein
MIPLSEYYTLEAFYDATLGETWNYHLENSVKWDFSDPSSADPCTWDGVYCTCSTGCNVNKLSLVNFNLTGYIPDLQNLTHLDRIFMAHNALYGTLDCFSKLPLLYLSIHDNYFEGSLDPLSNLTSLYYLGLTDNFIEGDLKALRNLVSLEYVYLYTNLLSGSLNGVSGLRFIQYISISDNYYIYGNLSEVRNLTTLKSLEISNSHLTGDLSHLTELTALLSIELSGNYLVGPVEYVGKLTALTKLDLGFNSLSGYLVDLNGLTNLVALLLHQNHDIVGTLADISTLSKAKCLILYGTYITGETSDIAIFPALKYLDFYALSIYGSLYDIRHMVSLVYLDLSANYITGNLEDISNLKNMTKLYLSENFIEGNIDKVNGMSKLNNLDLSYNTHIIGSLESFQPSQDMEVLVLQHNSLTGDVPSSIYNLQKLRVLNLARNCLSASLTDVCNAKSLEYLILDGLHTQNGCRKVMPVKFYDTIYSTTASVTNVPTCLYSMPNLMSLHLASNGITGSLPADAVLGVNFTEFVMSNNQMRSVIPDVFQSHYWVTLDLSYNKFTGTLQDSLTVKESVTLNVNRLSGDIPTSLYNTTDVNILTDNLFECSDEVLARLHDEVGGAYVCESSSFNAISILWVELVGTVVLLLLVSKMNIVEDPENYCVVRYAYAVIGYVKRKVAHVQRMYNVRDIIALSKLSVPTENINKFVEVTRNIRLLCAVIVGVYLFIFMPLYSAFSVYFGTYDYQYAWTVSAAFMSGAPVGITLFVLYVLALFALFYVIRYPAADAMVHNSKLPTSLKYYLVFGVIFVVNLAVVLPLNGVYVYVLLNYDQTIVSVVGFVSSFFKVIWTSYILVSIVRFAEDKILESKSHDLKELAILFIINIIFMPCLATSLVDPNCFYDTIYAPEISVSALNYYVDVYFRGNNPIIVYYSEYYNSEPLQLSWSYSYQCTSFILTSFATIFLYQSLLSTILPPILHHIKNKSITYVRSYPDSCVSKLLNLLPVFVTSYTGYVFNVTRINEALIQRFILQLVGSFAVLFSFGVMVPLLGLVIFMAIVGQTWYMQYVIGRYVNAILKKATLSHQEKEVLITEVDSELKDVGVVLMRSSWQILLFIGVFYGCFVFDIIGDVEGNRAANWAPISLFIISIALYVSPFYFKSYIFLTKQLARGGHTNQHHHHHHEKLELYNFANESGSDESIRLSMSGAATKIFTTINPMNSTFAESKEPSEPPGDDASQGSGTTPPLPVVI